MPLPDINGLGGGGEECAEGEVVFKNLNAGANFTSCTTQFIE